MNKAILLALSFLCLSSVHSLDKVYIDTEELDTSFNQFHVHMGNNRWMKTCRIQHDQQGIYIFDTDIETISLAIPVEWKCPYCYRWWPENVPCQNSKCPSKYK